MAGIAWIVGSDMQEDVLENVIFNCKEKSIPVVCTDCHSIRGYTVSHLISMGVKAVVNLHFSVIRIKEVMNIVQEGGIYMHNTNRTKIILMLLNVIYNSLLMLYTLFNYIKWRYLQ